eukprot:tig00001007_g6242.t1
MDASGGLDLERPVTPNESQGGRSPRSRRAPRTLKNLQHSMPEVSFLPPIAAVNWLTGQALVGKPKPLPAQPSLAPRQPQLRASRTVSGLPLQHELWGGKALATSSSSPAVAAPGARDAPDFAATSVLHGRSIFPPRRRRSGRRRRPARTLALTRLSETLLEEYEEDWEGSGADEEEEAPERRRAYLPRSISSSELGSARPRPGAGSPEPPGTPPAPRVRLDEIRLLRAIGSGGSSTVYEAEWRGQWVAVKRFLYRGGGGFTEEEVARFRQEAASMRPLRHPNVVALRAVCEDRRALALVMTLCPGGSLASALPVAPGPPSERERGPAGAPVPPVSPVLGPLDRPRIRRIALDIARGLAYLHGLPVPLVHRDLKTSNLYIAADGSVLIGDFGTACSLPESRCMTESGTLACMAPEVLRNEPANEKVDVYAFGMTLYEVVFLRRPFDDVRELNPLALGMAAAFNGLRPSLADCPYPALAPLLRDCWHPTPARRPSAAECVRFLEALPPDGSEPASPRLASYGEDGYDRESDRFERPSTGTPTPPYPPEGGRRL